MFTGIVQQLGRVRALVPAEGGARLTVIPSEPLEDLKTGESVANDGVCLTAEAGSAPDRLEFYLSRETLDRTTLGDVRPGAELNLERSLRLGDRMGGHFVLGHVDATGTVARLDRQGEGWDLRVEYPPELRRHLAPKGSVSVNGISLTVVQVTDRWFSVAVIPHTHEVTSLRSARAGTRVNLEADPIARHVADQLERVLGASGLTLEKLRQAGF